MYAVNMYLIELFISVAYLAFELQLFHDRNE